MKPWQCQQVYKTHQIQVLLCDRQSCHKGEVVIEHKPTKEMWIDVNTKPKQGTPFKIDRGYLMNCPINVPDDTLAMPRKAGST